jgi:hypothetical protein
MEMACINSEQKHNTYTYVPLKHVFLQGIVLLRRHKDILYAYELNWNTSIIIKQIISVHHASVTEVQIPYLTLEIKEMKCQNVCVSEI